MSFEYLSDNQPSIGSAGVDAFGHRDYANTVVAEMEHFPAQFTLGLFGDWGSGKSMILDEIGKRLKHRGDSKTAFVIFDAWRYEGDSLRREFIRSVGESLEEQKALREGFDFERHIEGFDTETTTVARRARALQWSVLRGGALAALLVICFALALILVLNHLGMSDPTREKLLIAFSSAAAAFVLFPLQRLIEPDPVHSTRRRLEFPDQFERNFRGLLNSVNTERLVIAIDNLDRCSPERVTEILSSIKTFLEPAFKDPADKQKVSWPRRLRSRLRRATAERRPLERMCFIVAADDAALRRHLTAQELSKAGSGEVDNASGEPGRQQAGLPAEVSASVEEYLRKFFGASLRIRALLDEDVRKFTGEQLKSFVESRNLDQETADEVIEMTSQGLKRNPRRIKQFVNNLQLRLQMLAERKAQGGIQIDADVRVVAKLAILEEEFANEFKDLERDPTLLVSWHAQAASAEEAAGEPDARELRPELLSFLRFTDHVQPRDIRAYLNLKQTENEVNLPRHGEFVELLDGGEVEKLSELLGEEAGERAAYTEAARSHFREQCRAKAWNRAQNTLRSIVEAPMLHGDAGKVVKMAIEEALREPSLKTRLGQLDPSVLLDAAVQNHLPRQTTDRIVTQLVDAIGSQQGEARRRISAALATHGAMVDTENRKRISEKLVTEDVRGDFDAFLPLAEEMPDVLREEVLDTALARIEELGPEGTSMSSAAFKVALAALRSSRDDERLERLLQLARTSLAAHRDASSEELGAVADELASAVDAGAPTPSMTDLANWLVSDWAAVPSGSRLGAMDLVLALCRQSSDAATAVGGTLADRIFELGDGDETVARLTRDFATLTDEAQNRVRVLTAEALAGAKPDVPEDKADQLLVLFPAETQATLIGDALEMALAAERGEVAKTLLSRLSQNDQKQVIVATLSRAEQAPAERMADMRFVVAHQVQIDEERLFQFASILAQTVHENRSIVITVAPLIGGLELADADRRMQIVERLIATERDMSNEDNREAMLRAAWNLAGKRRSKAREAITSRLEQIRNEGGGRMGAVASELLDAS